MCVLFPFSFMNMTRFVEGLFLDYGDAMREIMGRTIYFFLFVKNSTC